MWCDDIWFIILYLLLLLRTGCVQEPGNRTLLRNSAPRFSATALTHDCLPLKGQGKDSLRHMAPCWCMLGTWRSLQEHVTGATCHWSRAQCPEEKNHVNAPGHDARPWVVEMESCYPQSSLICPHFLLHHYPITGSATPFTFPVWCEILVGSAVDVRRRHTKIHCQGTVAL